jgi:uncharacterized membrane protein
MSKRERESANMIGSIILALLFILSGSLHFIAPQLYLRIVPPYLPAHLPIVYISGISEILGGIGLLVPSVRRIAAWGLVALLIAILPANIYMATAHLPAPGMMGQSWAQWLRIPLQLPLIYWAWLYTCPSWAKSLPN